MKKIIFLLALITSQFTFAQSGEEPSTFFFECNGDSILLDVSEFDNIPLEILLEEFDCLDFEFDSLEIDSVWLDDDWNWGEEEEGEEGETWDEEEDWNWEFDSLELDSVWLVDDWNWGEEEGEEEEWGEDIDALIEQLEIDCASQVDSAWSCGMLEMIYSCMNGSEDTCSYLEEFYEDFDFEEGEEEEDDEEEFDCINSNPNAYALYMSCINGDEGSCEALEMLCGGEEEGEEEEEEEEEWGDDIDALIEQLENDCASQVDLGWSCGMLEMIYSCMNGSEDTCSYLEEFYEDFDFEEEEEEEEEQEEEEEEWSWGEGENMSALFDAISSITVIENELVLVLQANDLIVSVFDESGFEFLPSLVDGYMVFGPFDIDELYNIIVENMDDLEVLWGLFRPMTSDIELIKEGVVSAIDNNFGDIFTLNQMVSIDEVHQDLKVYNTQYYDVMGRKVSNPSKGLYIEVQTTNIGEISTKRFILK